MAERILSVKKVSLAGISEGWDDECYAYVRPGTYDDNQELLDLEVTKKTDREQLEYQKDFVKKHFVSGKVKVFDGKKFVLDDLTADDTVASIALNEHLYTAMMGLDFDPKAIRKEAIAATLQPIDESNTEITSSEDSPKE